MNTVRQLKDTSVICTIHQVSLLPPIKKNKWWLGLIRPLSLSLSLSLSIYKFFFH